jgi:WD40 repeat protein
VKRNLRIKDASLGSLAYSPDGRLLAITDRRHNQLLLIETRIWRVKRRLKGDPPTETRPGPEFSAHASVTAARFSPDGRFLVTQHQDSSTDPMGVHSSGWIRLWDTKTWQPLRKMVPEAGPRSSVEAVAIAPNGRYVIAAARSIANVSFFTIWDLDVGAKRTDGEFEGRCESLTFASGGTVIVAGMRDGSYMQAYALFLEAATGEQLRKIPTDRVSSRAREASGKLAVSLDGQHVATVSPGHQIRLWHLSELLTAQRH